MGPCVVLVGFSEGAKWDLGPIFQLPCGKVLAQVGPLNMVQLRSKLRQPQCSTITLHFDPGLLPAYLLPESLWRATHWPGYLTMLFEVLALGAERKRGEQRGRDRDREIDVKRRAESEKDCSGRGNRGLNSDEIIQFVSWQNRQTERWAAATEQQPPGDLKLFHNRPHPPHTFDYKVNLCSCSFFTPCHWYPILSINRLCSFLHASG